VPNTENNPLKHFSAFIKGIFRTRGNVLALSHTDIDK